MDQIEKFKPLREPVKPMIELSVESRLAEIERRIPKDHLCLMVKEVVFSLDTSELESKYCFDGQKSYHPKLLLCLLFYGYATGVRSSRKLENKCISDDFYKYLMQYYSPDHRTISDFRKDHLECINSYFIDILRIFEKLGYKKVGKIYIDGTKIRANASAKRTKTAEEFEKWLCLLEEEISAILQEAEAIDRAEDEKFKISEEQKELLKKLGNRNYLKNKIEAALEEMREEDKEKMNLTDAAANNMKSGGSKDIRPNYNCQGAVTEDGVITSAEAITMANDQNQLQPMIEQSESNTCKRVEEVAADSNYGNYSTYEYLEEKGIDGYVPDDFFHQYKNGEYEKEKHRYHYINFEYDESSDTYICPEGKRLIHTKTVRRKGGGKGKGNCSRERNHKIYRGVDCDRCCKRSLCTKSRYREISIEFREPLLRAMREKLLSEEGGLKYFMRQYIIEPVFGHLKYNLGYRHFLLRGLEKVNGEFKLMCIGWNIKKMLNLGYTPQMVRNL